MVERSHEIERIYMQQLKNIESAIYVLRTKKSSYENSLRNLRKPIVDPVDPKKPKTDKGRLLNCVWIPLVGLVAMMGPGNICLAILSWFIDWIRENLYVLFVVIPVIVFLLLLGGLVYNFIHEGHLEKEEYVRRIEENIGIRRENEQQRKQNASLAKQREGQLAKINEELQRAIVVKDNLYSVNWIPGNYRNIRVAYYISDMVMSSAITMEEALKYYLLQEVNNKLDEVLRKLDEIIANQNQIIVNQAILESQNNELISQNENVIRRIAKTEESAQMAAEYAQVAMNYAEANAYFSWATYLKK